MKFKEHIKNGAPPGTLGLDNSTGWITSELFVDAMHHFIKYSNFPTEKPTLLIMDNHESHLNPVALKIGKNNGVNMVTLPSHTSDKIQPLDILVYRSPKNS